MMQLFFGIGTGRVASMSLANALDAENECICLHEGKVRHFEESGEQVLPFLTLQNRRAYEFPQEALGMFGNARGDFMEIAKARRLGHFGDIAYNYAPFIPAIRLLFPEAKIIFQFRDCLGFVISCTGTAGHDPTPVGWPPHDKALSKVERFIALGRLQPRMNSTAAVQWPNWTYIAKNIWLWAETNRVILDALDTCCADIVHRMKFEQFQAQPLQEYQSIRRFLGLPGTPNSTVVSRLTDRPINRRSDANRSLTTNDLNSIEQSVWLEYAEPVRARLGYA